MGVTPLMRVVLTPVRNEAWVLERFLQTCEQLADAIIILDQNSDDGSRDICRRHSKCLLLDNWNEDYDEAHRQRVLIEAARTRLPGQKILLALDADEIFTADSLDASLWEPCYSNGCGN